MALSQRLNWQKIGYLKPSRPFSSSSSSIFSWFSSSTKTAKSSQPKKSEAAKEQRTAAVESYVEKYMQKNPGIFPKATHVRNEVGGSWYLLKDILKDLKERMFPIKKQSPSERLDEMVDTVVSEARITGDSLDTTEVDKLKSIVQPSEGVTEPLGGKDNSTIPLHVSEEKHFVDIVKSEDPSNCIKLVESQEVDAFGKNSHVVLPHVSEDIPCVSIVKYEDSSNCVEPVHFKNGDEFEATSSTVFPDHEAASADISFLVRGLVSGEEKETRTLEISGEDEDHSSNKEITNCLAPNGASKSKETHPSSGGAEKITRAHFFMKPKMDTTLSDNDSLAYEISSNVSKESSGNVSMRMDIKGLIDSIKKLNEDTSSVSSNKTNQLKNGGLPKDKSATPSTHGTLKIDFDKQQKSHSGTYLCDVFQKRNLLDDNEEVPTDQVTFETSNSETMRYFDCKTSLNEEAFDYLKPKPSPKSPQLNQVAPQKRDINQFLFTAKGKNQANLLVRFLRNPVTMTDIKEVFKGCGPISEIHFIQSKKENKCFKDAYICFKTKKGLQSALAKTDVVVRGGDVVVSSADPSTSIPSKILPPNVVEDPEFPTALLENPARTVRLKYLPHDLALHQLREAFSFCGGQISCFVMGASNSVAYVEFETEDAKEKAIAASSITISGKQISVLRSDTPITTVIRICNVQNGTNVHSICRLHGQVKRVLCRSPDTVDVQFHLVEWPNMVKILNSLNGLVVNEQKWIAQPAPVIPVEILHTLWNQQDGRRQVCSVIQNLFQKLGESPAGLAELNSLVDQIQCGESLE